MIWQSLFMASLLLVGLGAAPKDKFLPEGEALERLLAIEYHRKGQDPFLKTALYHHSKRVVRTALLVHGRIGDPASIESLIPFITHADSQYRTLAGFSLSLIGGSLPLALLSQHAQMSKNSTTRGEFWTAVGRLGNEKTVALFDSALTTEKHPPTKEAICEGLGHLWNRSAPTWSVPDGLLVRLSKEAGSTGSHAFACAFALSRFRGEEESIPEAELQQAALAAKPDPRSFLLRALGRVQSESTATFLAKHLRTHFHHAVREEAAKALGFQKATPTVLEALKQGLSDSYTSVRVHTLGALMSLGASARPLVKEIEEAYTLSPSPWARASALRALAAVDPKRARPHVTALLASNDSPIYAAGIKALAALGSEAEIAKLVSYLSHQNVEYVAKAAEAMGALSAKQFTKEMKQTLSNALTRGDLAVTAVVADLIRKFKWTEFTDVLQSSYQSFTRPEDVEAKVAILNALAASRDIKAKPLVEAALKEPNRMIALAAAYAYREITGQEPSAPVPVNTTFNGISPPIDEVNKALGRTINIQTNRGSFKIRFLSLAPLNAYNFVSLVQKKFYDGKTFHRIVPNFVSQGGDPRGDGYGGPGYLVRDEVGLEPHVRGIVGLATAGKDTGGSQFFINLNTNHHLNGRYTAFGRVISGMDVVDRLEIDDKIVRATVE